MNRLTIAATSTMLHLHITRLEPWQVLVNLAVLEVFAWRRKLLKLGRAAEVAC